MSKFYTQAAYRSVCDTVQTTQCAAVVNCRLKDFKESLMYFKGSLAQSVCKTEPEVCGGNCL
jgi:hypothetical protein